MPPSRAISRRSCVSGRRLPDDLLVVEERGQLLERALFLLEVRGEELDRVVEAHLLRDAHEAFVRRDLVALDLLRRGEVEQVEDLRPRRVLLEALVLLEEPVDAVAPFAAAGLL